MASVFIKNARAIVTVDDQDRVLYNSNLLIEDGVITYIGQEEKQAERVIDASNCFVYPGLINTHHHLYQTFTRNLPQVQNMELFPWLVALYEIWRGLNPECIYYSSLTGMGELARYGCTTCMDQHYVFPQVGSEEFIDMQFDAAAALGLRFHATRGSMSRGKSDGGLPPDDLVQPVDRILQDCERLVKKYHDNRPLSMRQVSLAPCSPFSVTTELLKETAVLARSLGVRMHTHLCETKDEEQFCLEVLGKRPLEYMMDCGWIGSDVWFAHGIYFNDQELQILADTQTGIAHCPVSNMKLASGVCRIPDILPSQRRLRPLYRLPFFLKKSAETLRTFLLGIQQIFRNQFDFITNPAKDFARPVNPVLRKPAVKNRPDLPDGFLVRHRMIRRFQQPFRSGGKFNELETESIRVTVSRRCDIPVDIIESHPP